MPQETNFEPQRRKFITDAAKAAASALILSSPLGGMAAGLSAAPVTVGQVMDLFIHQVPGAPFADTIDTLKTGNRDTVVTGIVTTMFATIDVIRKAVDLGANFIIAHEPTFYNHQDATQWLENDEVYQYKVALLKQHNIAVWRNHDYIHSITPDPVIKALARQLGWENLSDTEEDIYNLLPPVTLKTLISNLKQKLNIQGVRYIGALNQPCKKVLLMPGAAGGKQQITELIKNRPDVLVVGEISEWETAEYVRDARAKGQPLALVVIGHIASEEWGSQFMASWLKTNFPAVKTTFVAAGSSLSFL